MRNHCNRLDCLINNQKGICRALRETGDTRTCKFYKDRRKISKLEIACYEAGIETGRFWDRAEYEEITGGGKEWR